jgi:coenzyme PQQ synthesis protein D (PqqD)
VPDDLWPLPHSVPTIRDGVTTVWLEENVGLYDQLGHALMVLNASASAIWGRCDGSMSFDDMVADLARHTCGDAGAIRDDVWRTLRMLADHGLLIDLRD